MRVPKFKNHIRVRTLPPDLVFFIHDSGYRVIQGELLCAIAPLVDGLTTAGSIAAKVSPRWNIIDVECGLLLFQAEGYLSDSTTTPLDEPTFLADWLNVDRRKYSKRLRETKIRVASFNHVSKTQFESILRKLGITLSERGNFTVALVDDYLCDGLEELNQSAIENNQSWMILKPFGIVPWFGPAFIPNSGPCWRCLAERLKEKRRLDLFLRANGSPDPTSISRPETIDPATTAVFNLAAIHLLQAITESPESAFLFTLDPKRIEMEKHTVMRRMDCAVCGIPAAPFPTPIQIHRNARNSTTTANLLERLKHHISFRTGIVDEMKNIEVDPPGLIHSVVADHLFVPTLNKEDLLRKGLTQKSWGRGTTVEAARTGALLESLERYSGVFRGSEYRIQKTQNDLGIEAIPLNDCLNFSESQYNNRDHWNRRSTPKEWVPMRLDPNRKIEWTPVWSLTNETFRYLPTAYCYYGYPLQPDHAFCRADSNGNAAGETMEQAILHGFLELVERDCASMWWFNRVKRPGVCVNSFCNAYLDQIDMFYKNVGRTLWVLDITNDFGIPCFAALSAESKNASHEFLIGLAADFDPLIAITRAITEMNQFLAVRLQSKKKVRSVPAGRYLYPSSEVRPKTFEHYKPVARMDDAQSVKKCVRLAKQRSMETFVLDQTRSDVELPVVKVIVPGMRQIWRRFARGRLYDVPFQLGWIPRPATEFRLNPHPFLV